MYIVATISKNSYTADKIEEILLAGAAVLRYNFSHGTPAEMFEKVNVAKGVIRKLNLEGRVKILADLPGDKIRLGHFAAGQHEVQKCQEVIFKSAKKSPDPAEFIPVDFPEIGKLVDVGQKISCGDGELGFEVVKIINVGGFVARVLNSRHIPALKGLNIGRGIDELEHITPETVAHVRHLREINPDWVAFSFVNSAEYLKKAKTLLCENGLGKARLVSKIESPLALRNIKAIVEGSDIVMVARGDLGLTMPIELLGISQKKIVKAAKEAGKEVIVATQILDSLLSYYTPSRAEVLDLTNIVLDGADGIMLAKETGISATPGYSVAVAKKIIESVERSLKKNLS